MKKLPSITVPNIKPSKKVITLAVTSLIVLVLLVLSLAVYQKHRTDAQAQARVEAQHQAAVDKQRADELASLKTQVASLQADKTAACTYLKTVSTARQSRGLVSTPVIVHCP